MTAPWRSIRTTPAAGTPAASSGYGPASLDLAIEHIEVALRLSPRARVGASLITLSGALLFSRRFDAAVPKLLLLIQQDPGYSTSYRYLAACYAHMGRFDDARAAIAQLRAISSVVIPDLSYLRNAAHRELFISGLKLATSEAD